MDDGDGSEGDSESRPGPKLSNAHSNYQQEGEPSDPLASHPTINLKRRRTTAPALEGTSRGFGPDRVSHFETGPEVPGSSSHSHSFDPAYPPVGWVLETELSEYAQENAKLYDLHTLRPRLPHSEEVTQDLSNADVDMEEKVVKERYEERNRCVVFQFDPRVFGRLTTRIRLLGSLFLERQRRLTGA